MGLGSEGVWGSIELHTHILSLISFIDLNAHFPKNKKVLMCVSSGASAVAGVTNKTWGPINADDLLIQPSMLVVIRSEICPTSEY